MREVVRLFWTVYSKIKKFSIKWVVNGHIPFCFLARMFLFFLLGIIWHNKSTITWFKHKQKINSQRLSTLVSHWNYYHRFIKFVILSSTRIIRSRWHRLTSPTNRVGVLHTFLVERNTWTCCQHASVSGTEPRPEITGCYSRPWKNKRSAAWAQTETTVGFDSYCYVNTRTRIGHLWIGLGVLCFDDNFTNSKEP